MVKDLFKLRKYNIHEVNKQIFQSQNSGRQEDENGNDQSIEKTNDINQDIPTTDMSHTGDTVVHDFIQDTANPNIITIKESQE